MAFISALKRTLGLTPPPGSKLQEHEAEGESQAAANQPDSQAATPTASPRQAVPQSLIDEIAGLIGQYIDSTGSGGNIEIVDNLRNQLKLSQAQAAEQERHAAALLDQVAKLQNANEQLALEKKNLDNKLRVMQVKANGQNPAEAVDQLTSEYKQKMEITNQLLNDLRADAARKTKELERLKAQIAQGNPHAAQLKDKDDEIARLKQQLDNTRQKLDEANENLKIASEIEEKIKEVDAFKAKKNKEIADMKTDIENQRAINAKTINDQRDQLLKTQAERDDLLKRLNRMQQEATETKAKHKRRDVELANRIDDLKRQVNIAAKKIDSNDHLVANLNKTISDQLKTIQDLTIARDELKLKAGDTLTMLNRAQDEAKNKGSQLQQLRAAQEASLDTARQLRSQLDAARRQLDERDRALAETRDQLKHSETQVQKMAALALKQEPKVNAESETAIDTDLQEAVAHVFNGQQGQPRGEEPPQPAPEPEPQPEPPRAAQHPHDESRQMSLF